MGYDLAYATYRSRYRSSSAAVTHVSADRVIAETRELQAQALVQAGAHAERLHSAQLEAAETIREAIEQSAWAICAELNWGFARLCGQLQQQNQELRKIVELLERPLETAAREMKRRAEVAYGNQWTDEAIRDFEKCRDLNYQDFSIYLYLGNLYFFDKQQPEEALKNYHAAARYSNPHSPEFAARALLHVSLVERCAENYHAAYAATQGALALMPGLPSVQYEHAVNACLFQKSSEALRFLESAIHADAALAVKANSDRDFAQMSGPVGSLIDTLRDEAKRKALENVERAERLCYPLANFWQQSCLKRSRLKDVHDALYQPGFCAARLPEVDQSLPDLMGSISMKISELRELCLRNTYLECRAAARKSQGFPLLVRIKVTSWFKVAQDACISLIADKRHRLNPPPSKEV
ncbi:MAG: hypothetical protein HYY24_17685 [Verrucomicrobia bacterium]|nr:hypothetical protein [Verrucomicrobiota bacterium]